MVVISRRIYPPKHKTLKEEVLKEAHESIFIVHPGSTKMKKEIAKYMARCRVCQQIKIEYQKPARPLQPLLILEWK